MKRPCTLCGFAPDIDDEDAPGCPDCRPEKWGGEAFEPEKEHEEEEEPDLDFYYWLNEK